jgi:hypothetical protein
MVDHLYDLVPAFEGQESRIRCFAHILNLVVKAILSVFGMKRKQKGATQAEDDDCMVELEDDEDLDDEDIDEEVDEDLDPEREAWDEAQIEAVGEILERDLQQSPHRKAIMEQIQVGTLAIHKVCLRHVSTLCYTHTFSQNDKLCRKSATSSDFSDDLLKSAKENGNDSPRELVKPVIT